ncbi:hypothetical protein [Cobetia marina]|uniref:hypothetical protein n=1 Tax=Cobetia marina TaxID=28258 RepID=UPI003857DFA7
MHTITMAPVLLGLGLMLSLAIPGVVAADDRHRSQGQQHHGRQTIERHSTPQSRHEAIKRRHLRMFDEPRVERHHSRHDPRHRIPQRRYYQHERYAPHQYRQYDSRRHDLRRRHDGVSIGFPAIRINIH